MNKIFSNLIVIGLLYVYRPHDPKVYPQPVRIQLPVAVRSYAVCVDVNGNVYEAAQCPKGK